MLDSSSNMVAYTTSIPIEEHVDSTTYQNDDLNDVFGSEPSSPISHAFEQDDELNLSRDPRNGVRQGNSEPSDVPRMQSKHETEGYRDGITQGKTQSVQTGFDEGYNLGAVLGLQIGKVVGVIEGLHSALATAVNGLDSNDKKIIQAWGVEKDRLDKLLAGAREELKTASIFGPQWWAEDGTWRFPVPGEAEGDSVVFPDVAAAHPLVLKWHSIVEEEIERWNLDMKIMDLNRTQEEKTAVIKEDTSLNKSQAMTTSLAW